MAENSNIPSTPTSQPPVKKSRWWLWGLIGCGGLIVIVLAVVVAGGAYLWHKAPKSQGEFVAKMIELSNPDVKVLSIDEDKGIVTVQNKKTGEETTINLEDAKAGKISVTKDGKTESLSLGGDVSEMPSWVPIYPGAKAEGGMSLNQEDKQGGTANFTTPDSVQDVADFYEGQLVDQGLELQDNQMNNDTMKVISAENADGSRKASVVITRSQDTTQISLTYGHCE